MFQLLGDVAAVISGQHIESTLYSRVSGATPYLTGPADFTARHPLVSKWTDAPKVFARASDVLVTVKGAGVGKVNWGCDAAIGRQLMAIRPEGGSLEQSYLFHFLRSQESRLNRLAQGATVPGIDRDDLLKLRIPTPPIREQRRIAEILDKTDALRAQRRAALAQLDTLTQSVFLDMFGDPVRDPKWPVQPLGSLLNSLRYGPRFYNEAYADEGVRVVRISDLTENGSLDFDAMPKLAVSEQELQKSVLKAGDVIFARTGATVGKTAVVREFDPTCIAGAYFIVMRFDVRIEPEYARSVLSSSSVREIVVRRSRQAAQQNFSGPGLRQLPMPVPPISLQQVYAARLRAIHRIAERLQSSQNETDSLFASLQHRAFRGEL